MKKDYTSLDLSKRLHEAGFRAETDRFHHTLKHKDDKRHTNYFTNHPKMMKLSYVEKRFIEETEEYVYPAYSAQTLFEALPSKIKPMSYSTGEGSKTFFLTVVKTGETEYFVSYENLDRSICSQQGFLLEALGEMVLELIKRGIIKPKA